ncbi:MULTISPECIES: hypothetical protein [Myroides]|uniref:Uncharacterized protein n=1 Tax=Myroides phaeus TaxID=702745 RepID=A0A1G8CV60_9FLAO|nr:hypothetical protein [Myroides phaeus]MEC4116264.1 hypothetical protein [Myroides phaeus]SDH49392.1 hypothetical protein SAMN05421818_10529 [Myroides phaeus]
MIIALCVIVIIAILLVCVSMISRVLRVYLLVFKDKELWDKEIEEDTKYQFIKGLY